jgi:hypothetical protein
MGVKGMTGAAGYGFDEFLADLCTKNIDPNESIYNWLLPVDVAAVLRWQKRLKRVRDLKFSGKDAKRRRGDQSRLIGKIFERMLSEMLLKGRIFTHSLNVRSTTSELDFLIQLGPLTNAVPMLRNIGSQIIGEAKCVRSNLASEWIQKLAGVMATHQTTLGILFTAAPSKKLPSPIRFSLALHYKQTRIVPFGIRQIDQVLSGKSFLGVLSHQHSMVATHSSELCI